MTRSLAAILVVLLLAALGACKSGPTKDETRGWSVDKLYTEAKSELNSGNYKKAIGYYEKLE